MILLFKIAILRIVAAVFQKSTQPCINSLRKEESCYINASNTNRSGVITIKGQEKNVERCVCTFDNIIERIKEFRSIIQNRRTARKQDLAWIRNQRNKLKKYIPKDYEIKEINRKKFDKKQLKAKTSSKERRHKKSGHAWHQKSRWARGDHLWIYGTKSKVNRSKKSIKRINNLDHIDYEDYEIINAWDSFKFPAYWYGSRETADGIYEAYGVPSDGPFLITVE